MDVLETPEKMGEAFRKLLSEMNKRVKENLELLGTNGKHNTMLDSQCKQLLTENAKLKERIRELEAKTTL